MPEHSAAQDAVAAVGRSDPMEELAGDAAAAEVAGRIARRGRATHRSGCWRDPAASCFGRS